MAYTLQDFIKLNPNYQSRYDPKAKTASLYNTQSGKQISFGLGQGQQYGLGGIQGGSHLIDDPGKLMSALSGPAYQPYESPYGDKIGQTLAAIQDRPSFSYDPAKDVGLQTAQTTAMDTVSRAAARRNMLYSDSNKSQMGKSALALVPQFEQAAFNKYAQEGQSLYDQLSALQGTEQQSYGQYRDTVGDQQFAQQFAYQQARDSIGDQFKQKEFDENVRQFGLGYALQKLQADRDYELGKGQLAISRTNAARGGGGGGGSTYPYRQLDDAMKIMQLTGTVPPGLEMFGLKPGTKLGAEKGFETERQGLISAIRTQDISPEDAFAQIEQDVKLGFYSAAQANQLKKDLQTLTGYTPPKPPKPVPPELQPSLSDFWGVG
ncbi:MAG: hypothetical protein WC616_02390 [Candidatus Omnitrophota bacterium]